MTKSPSLRGGASAVEVASAAANRTEVRSPMRISLIMPRRSPDYQNEGVGATGARCISDEAGLSHVLFRPRHRSVLEIMLDVHAHHGAIAQTATLDKSQGCSTSQAR